jgi:hypothetical protein
MDKLFTENQTLKEVVSNGTVLIETLDTKLEESNKINQALKEVVSNGTVLIETLEEKLEESNKINQILKKEMQVLIYKAQLAYIEVDKKNSMIANIVFINLIMGIFWLVFIFK